MELAAYLRDRPESMASTTHRNQKRIPGLPGPAALAAELRHLPGFVFLDSSSADGVNPSSEDERFSLITANPESILTGNLFDEADFSALRATYLENLDEGGIGLDIGFPTSGLYGSVDYDGEFRFGLYRDWLAYDHAAEDSPQQGWIGDPTLFDSGLPTHRLTGPPRPPRFPRPEFQPGMAKADFCRIVEQAQEYIAAGDIYQVNLSHRFSGSVPEDFDSFALHLALRESSPAPYAAYLDQGDREIVSSSPEQFLRMSGQSIQTRPIKGTRPRFRDREMDEKSAYDLLTSAKEVAELVMITDLERNDLGQICEFGSVEATELLKLERFAQVFHLVSTVEGTLREEVDHVSALRACFPGGSITGAPKKRAREIISELENVPRGHYTGTVGVLGFNGESRFNIAIRTAIREKGKLHFHVGAGIVADSQPEKEWEETLHKAAGILQAAGSPSDGAVS